MRKLSTRCFPWLVSRNSRDRHGSSSAAPASSEGVSDAVPASSERVSDTVPLGLLRLAGPTSTQPLLDIVAVHGLGEHRLDTWTDTNNVCWLRDLLPKKTDYAQIFSYGYDANLTFSKSTAKLQDFALGFLDELDNTRRSLNGNKRPVIFIGHSLGGIVIKKSIILALEQQDRFGDILSSIRGIIFLATPHRGSKLANWTKITRSIIDAACPVTSPVRKSLLRDLETNSLALKTTSESFQHRALHFKIASFYETIFTSPLKMLVVDKKSAVLGFPGEEVLPINADHRKIAKIATIDSLQWKSILGVLERQIGDLQSDHHPENQALQVANTSISQSIHEADGLIRKYYHSRDRLKIKRLSGEELELEKCYINLALIDRPKDMKKKEQTSFSIEARLQLDVPEADRNVSKMDQNVSLANLFDPRKLADGNTFNPRRIFIHVA